MQDDRIYDCLLKIIRLSEDSACRSNDNAEKQQELLTAIKEQLKDINEMLLELV